MRGTKSVDLGKDRIGVLIAKLAVPAVVAQIINLLYNLVDRMYVSAIPGEEGTLAIAGLGVVFPITLIVSAFANLVGLGGAPLASIFLGERKKEEASRVFNAGTVLLVLFGVVLTAAVLIFCEPLVRAFGAPTRAVPYGSSYLFVYGIGSLFVMFSLGLNPFISAQGFSFTAMFTVAIGAVLNIAFDPLFIFVFDMGVEGAALATILSQAVSAVWAVCFFFRRKTEYRFRLSQLRLPWSIVRRIVLLGLSPFIMSVTESAIQIVFNNNLTRWSGDNEDYTAALTIMLSAIQMVCMPLNGLGNGVQPVVSFNYGTGDSARIRKTVKITALIALCGSVSVWLLSLLAPQVYGYMFNASPAVMELVRRYTPYFMMGTVMFFAQMTLQNVFIALNQARISIFLACLRKVILLIPLCFALPYAFGVSGVFYSEGIADIVAGVITAATFFCMLPRILKKREILLAQNPPAGNGQAGSAAEETK